MSRSASRARRQARHASEQERLDQGADGPAALTRARTIIKVATGDTRRGREQAEAVQVLDHPLDHYSAGALLTDRQIDAGWAVVRVHLKGYGLTSTSGGYGEYRGSDESDDADEARTRARKQYADMIGGVPVLAWASLEAVVFGAFPRQVNGLLRLREALDAIADRLKLPSS